MDVTSVALKDLADEAKLSRDRAAESEHQRRAMFEEQAGFVENVRLGNIHDGRLDCVAGNGIMGELGMGVEPEPNDYNTIQGSLNVSAVNAIAPVSAEDATGEEETPAEKGSASQPKRRPGEYSQIYGPSSIAKAMAAMQEYNSEEEEGKASTADLDQIPVVIIRGFDEKDAASKGNDVLFSGMADWAAALVENKVRRKALASSKGISRWLSIYWCQVAHVIFVNDSVAVSKSLARGTQRYPLYSTPDSPVFPYSAAKPAFQQYHLNRCYF